MRGREVEVSLMRLLLALLLGVAPVPTAAFGLDAGDLLIVGRVQSTGVGVSVVAYDRITGDRTVVSGCANLDCSNAVGAGPPLPNLASDPSFEITYSAGKIFVLDQNENFYRIDPITGDRTLLTGTGPTVLEFEGGLTAAMPWVVPDAVPSWGLTLVAMAIAAHASWMLATRRRRQA